MPRPQKSSAQSSRRSDLGPQHLHNPRAEESLIASILLDDGYTLSAAVDAGISERSFYSPQHRIIFNAALNIHRSGNTADVVTVADYLNKEKLIDSIGGFAQLSIITNAVPTTAHSKYYIEEVVRISEIRELAKASDDFKEAIASGNDEAATAALNRMSQRKSAKLPALGDITKLILNPPPEPETIIEGVLHRGSKLIIGGTSKGRKTWSLLDLAVSVATGKPWWGWETKKGKVIYLNFEIQEPFFVQRAKAVAKAKGVDIEAGMLMTWNLRGHAQGIEKLRPAILSRLLGEDAALIIADPIYKLLGDRDENKAGDVAAMLNELEQIAVKTGAAVAFGAHYAKGNASGKSSIDRVGGSGVFARDPDAIITMTDLTDDDCLAIEATLRNNKPVEPFGVRWKFPLFVRDDNLDPADLKRPSKGGVTKKSGYTPEEILSYFPDSSSEGEGLASIQRSATEGCGVSKATFMRIRTELLDMEWVVQTEDKRYRRTSAGDLQANN